MADLPPETVGAWIVHHGRKVAADTNGASEYPALDEAAKAAELLCRLSESNDTVLSNDEVSAIAKATKLNPRTELRHFIEKFEERRLVEKTDTGLKIIGVTTRGTLSHAAGLFDDAEPANEERAAIDIAERTSVSPILTREVTEYVGDQYGMTTSRSKEFIRRARQVGFVDSEGDGNDQLLFNGNLFRRDNLKKTTRVLASLTTAEQRTFQEFSALLQDAGCVAAVHAEKVLGQHFFDKLRAAGLLDVNVVANDTGQHAYVTLPGSFHKFVDPMVDDCFDMAKALTAALTYGMSERSAGEGRIRMLPALLRKLINGNSVGPATAIGADYRVLEHHRVIKIEPTPDGLFTMRLLKKEVGELALKVLTTGDANASALKSTLRGAAMTGFIGPEASRTTTRKNQSEGNKFEMLDIVDALRGGLSR